MKKLAPMKTLKGVHDYLTAECDAESVREETTTGCNHKVGHCERFDILEAVHICLKQNTKKRKTK